MLCFMVSVPVLTAALIRAQCQANTRKTVYVSSPVDKQRGCLKKRVSLCMNGAAGMAYCALQLTTMRIARVMQNTQSAFQQASALLRDTHMHCCPILPNPNPAPRHFLRRLHA